MPTGKLGKPDYFRGRGSTKLNGWLKYLEANDVIALLPLTEVSDGSVRGITDPRTLFDGYPWISSEIDPDWTPEEGGIYYDVVFGFKPDGMAGFSPSFWPIPQSLPAAIKCFEFEIGDPEDTSASAMSLIIGNTSEGSGGVDLDGLSFRYTDNLLQFNWTSEVNVFLTNAEDDPGESMAINISLDPTNSQKPVIAMRDEGGQTLQHDILSGPESYYNDADGNTISLDINELPELVLTSDTYGDAYLCFFNDAGSGPTMKLEDLDSNQVVAFINDGVPEIQVTDGTQVALMEINSYPIIRALDNASTPSNGIQMTIDGFPALFMADDWSAYTDGSYIQMDLESGPNLLLSNEGGALIQASFSGGPQIEWNDNDGNTIVIDISSYPEAVFTSEDNGSIKLDLETYPELYMESSDDSTVLLSAELTNDSILSFNGSDGSSMNLTSELLYLNSITNGASVDINTLAISGKTAQFQATEVVTAVNLNEDGTVSSVDTANYYVLRTDS